MKSWLFEKKKSIRRDWTDKTYYVHHFERIVTGLSVLIFCTLMKCTILFMKELYKPLNSANILRWLKCHQKSCKKNFHSPLQRAIFSPRQPYNKSQRLVTVLLSHFKVFLVPNPSAFVFYFFTLQPFRSFATTLSLVKWICKVYFLDLTRRTSKFFLFDFFTINKVRVTNSS